MKIMDEGYLALRWNNHNTAFKNLLQTLREQEIYTDVSLACGKKLFHAHKFVLSTCSDSFKDIFSQINSKLNTVVYLTDILPNDLECILDFMYMGEVHIARSELGSLLRTAENLQVKGLAVPDEDGMDDDHTSSSTKVIPPPSLLTDVKSRRNPLQRCPKRLAPTESPGKTVFNPQKRMKTDDVSLRNNNISRPVPKPNEINTGAAVDSTSVIEDVDMVRIKKEITQAEYERAFQEDARGGFEDNEINSSEALDGYFKEEYMDDNYNHSNFSFGNSEISTSELLQVDLNEDGEKFLLGDAALSEAAQALVAEEGIGVQRKPFACSLCPNTFTRRDNLTNHVKTHMGDRPYMCQYCKKRFTRKDYLKQHERIHTGEKPFQCPTCSRAFTRKEGLTDHMRCHSDLKEFVCDICNREFKQKCGLRFHKRNYHQ